ncbi:hypothetical protein CR513_33070, partial [Mucuna pruriens]
MGPLKPCYLQDEHINAYVTQVNLFTNDGAILCRVFPISLKGDNSKLGLELGSSPSLDDHGAETRTILE